ncbi:MAG: glycoside hydrolase family 13 protein, partial [Bacteroidales bacterium]|nr:glycoside hydrolase family 13 protein [Bacteroidales bacterium]
LMFFSLAIFAQNINLERADPPFWWIGMKNPELQLMVHGENISLCQPEINYPGVKLKSFTRMENPNYLFIDLEIEHLARPGKFEILFKNNSEIVVRHNYELLQREPGSAQRKGFDESDIIYLALPDRFANGDPSNDSHPDMAEKSDRSIPDSRHGGDLQGVMDKIDYLHNLGITALWLNPVLENNQPTYSYHGYAITDFYKVDARFGSNQDFKMLNDILHQRGMKAVMDMVFNHCGHHHWWMDDLPSEDWINQWPEYTRSNFRAGTVFDPYASDYDRDRFDKGWFDKNMPDLNQRNRFLQTYLVQNSIWWIEYSGLNGIRMDTYPYPFKEQMAEWAQKVMCEYPDFSIVGEVWIGQPALVAPWESSPAVKSGYSSNLNYVFDFPMYDAFGLAFNEKQGWNSGMTKFYDVLTHDFLYGDEVKIVTFADNHDGNRLFTKLKENLNSQKMAMTFLLTSRGVPQIYYGTEILMTGDDSNGHGSMRKDFPGGWAGDEANKFEASGRTDDENEMFEHLTTLTKWRNNNKVAQSGKLKHYIPENNMYVYFRYDDQNLVMVILNNSENSRKLDVEKYVEILEDFKTGVNILDGEKYNLTDLQIPANTSMVLEIK